jgi:hypothetical protein
MRRYPQGADRQPVTLQCNYLKTFHPRVFKTSLKMPKYLSKVNAARETQLSYQQ